MDHITKEKRSWNMSLIRGKNTAPEMIVRSFMHKMGFRFRLHSKKLPGKPDLVLPKYKTIIFVHGCYWHHHENCRRANWPKSNSSYWIPKILNNIRRDNQNIKELQELGWNVHIIWECETKNIDNLSMKIKNIINKMH